MFLGINVILHNALIFPPAKKRAVLTYVGQSCLCQQLSSVVRYTVCIKYVNELHVSLILLYRVGELVG